MGHRQRSDRTLRLSYFLRIPNVGDRINPDLVSALTGIETCHTRGNEAPYLLAAGSNMSAANLHSHVWGTGVMHPSFGTGSAPAPQIHALRGHLSYMAVQAGGVALSDVPLGDPGFLAPELLGIKRKAAPRFRLGIVPHYVDRHNPVLQRLTKGDGVADLDVHAPPKVFLDQMADCGAVISTSLHGLIFAEALGIPNLWAKVSDEIAGGDFKYQDWFTTTRRPQELPYTVTASDTVEALCQRAELHDSAIDSKALAAAFPYAELDNLSGPRHPHFVSTEDCRSRPTPVFLISFDRGKMLQKVITSIKRQSHPTDIVVHDNGSTDASTKRVLAQLEADGTKVVRRSAIHSAEELNLVDVTVQDYFDNWAEPARYVVSDCDVDLAIASPHALDVYNALLNRFRQAECVGPMLRIRDIPLRYPLYNHVMNRHIEQFWSREPEIAWTGKADVAVQRALIDTTLAMHRAGENFRRLKSGIRVYEPFEALHLDWYNTSSASDYSQTSSATISHWDNKAETAAHRDVSLKFADYVIVRSLRSGALRITRNSVERRSRYILPLLKLLVGRRNRI